MADAGHEATEKIIAEMEKKLSKQYAQAEKEVKEKLDDYFRRFEAKDAKWQEWVKNGVKTDKQYKQWRTQQIAQGERWAALKEQLAEDFQNANKIARSTIDGYMPEIYAINHNYGIYQIENGGEFATSLTLYDRQTVERLMRDDPELLPPPGKTVSKAISQGRAERWSRQKLQSVMTQGILQGESIPKLATRLAKEVGESNRKAAIRNARTMATNAQNAGRYDSYRRARDKGIDLTIEWQATLDQRTRHDHRMMHGQRREVDEPFEVDGVKILYPAQLKGGSSDIPQSMIWNCRCTLLAWVKGFEGETIKQTKRMEGMSFEEWQEARPVYRDIEHTDRYQRDVPENKTVVVTNNDTKPKEKKIKQYLTEEQAAQYDSFRDRMSESAQQKFDARLQNAEFESTTNGGSYYDPETGKIIISSNSDDPSVVFHEGTHFFDYSQKYEIAEDWKKSVWEYNEQTDDYTRKIITERMVIKKDASFSEYVAHKWNAENDNGGTLNGDDLRNVVKKIGLSDTYGNDRTPENIKKDISAVREYFKSKGISSSDPDFGHISDFVSALTYDASLGSIVGGGHDYNYWTNGDEMRVTEIVAGYNLLESLGRTDLLAIEKELAPSLMRIVEKEWKKIW